MQCSTAFPLMPHEIDALPIAPQIYATLAAVRDEEFHSFDEEAEKLENCIKELRERLIEVLELESDILGPVADKLRKSIRNADRILED